MRHTARLLCCTAIVAVAMTACGGSPQSPVATSRAEVFPLTISRTGGIAGFSDVLVVSGNGLVTVAQKGRSPWSCQLAPDAANQLRAAVSAVPWPRLTPASTQPAFPDDLVTTAQSAAGGPARLEDPQMGAAGQVLNELVSDLYGGRSASGRCRLV